MQPRSGDVVMLGLAGFVVLAWRRWTASLRSASRRPRCAGLSRVRRHRPLPRPTPGRRARCRRVRSPGAAALAQTDLALPRAGLPKQTWTEQHPQIGARMSLSQRARKTACRRVGNKASPSPPWPETWAWAGMR